MRPISYPTDPAALALLTRMSAKPWAVLRHGPGSGSDNMALDEAHLSAAAAEQGGPTLRFYSWNPPAVSLGHFQETASIDLAYIQRRGWDVVRRSTGGRGVLHQYEVTYSVVLPPSMVAGAGIRTSYSVLTGALNSGLEKLVGSRGSDPQSGSSPSCAAGKRPANCFALTSACDTLVPGGKLVGSAQVRKGGALLQHGSILLDVDAEAWQAIFGELGHPVTLRQLLGVQPSPQSVENAILEGFADWGMPLKLGA